MCKILNAFLLNFYSYEEANLSFVNTLCLLWNGENGRRRALQIQPAHYDYRKRRKLRELAKEGKP
jgi:hypothetical protein